MGSHTGHLNSSVLISHTFFCPGRLLSAKSTARPLKSWAASSVSLFTAARRSKADLLHDFKPLLIKKLFLWGCGENIHTHAYCWWLSLDFFLFFLNVWEEGFIITGSFFSLFIKPKVANSLIQKRTVSFRESCVVSREVFLRDFSDRTVGFSPAARTPLTQPEQQYFLALSCQPVWQPCPLLPTWATTSSCWFRRALPTVSKLFQTDGERKPAAILEIGTLALIKQAKQPASLLATADEDALLSTVN